MIPACASGSSASWVRRPRGETNVAAWTDRADVWFEWELDAVRERVAVPLDGMMRQSYAIPNPRGARTRGRTRADRARCGTVTTPGQGAFYSKQ